MGCNANAVDAGTLEQARSKMPLAHIPKGHSQAHELRARLALWEGAEFLPLLERVEAQGRAHRAGERASRKDETSARVARGRRMARGGAYRKAVQAQQVEAAAFSPEDERDWAARLLPASERPAGERHEAAHSRAQCARHQCVTVDMRLHAAAPAHIDRLADGKGALP